MNMHNSTFKGSVNVRSTPHGYAVRFEGQTDAHDLGHALAAIITSYIDHFKKAGGADTDSALAEVREGIVCGLEHNPVPLKGH
jgi:hypothetical protein